MNNNNTIQKRIKKDQELIIEQLKRTPIVQAAVEKVGVARSTFYRWKKEDPAFARQADEALDEGIRLMSDFAESKILSAIQDGNLTAAMYWLNHRHIAYRNKLEVMAGSKQEEETLTAEQLDLINKALKIAALIPSKVDDEDKK